LKTTLILQPDGAEQLRWQSVAGDVAGRGSAAELAATAAVHDAELVLVVPAQRVLVRTLAFDPHERGLLRRTVPYSLEEQLIDDVDDQHFALGPIAGGQVPVAVVARQWLAQWLERCATAGLEVKRALPEQLLLPWREGCWSLRPEPELWLVRIDRWRGFALEPASAALALQLLLDDAEQLPQQLSIYGAQPLEDLLPQLPELLRGIAAAQPEPAAALPAPGQPVIDLLQGAFARVLPWRRWWHGWRWPAGALALAVLVQFVVAGLTHHQLARQNLALRQQIEQTYRSVEPRGALVDAEKQLRRHVAVLQGDRGGGLVPLLQQVGGALTGTAGVKLQNFSYSDRQGEIRLNLQADSFKDVEAVRLAIADKGLDAQLVGSSADGDKTRAQLRIMEQR
jgi:type II secretion system protein L